MQRNKEIRLLNEGCVVSTATVDAYLGKRNFRNVHDDAKYLSDPQFHLFRASNGLWAIEHVAGAKNETLVDGCAFSGAKVLASGMTVTVGNSGKGIQKFPLTVQIDVVDEAAETPPEPSTVDSSPAPAIEPEPSREESRREAETPSRSGTGSAIASALGSFAGAVLRGIVAGIASSGSSSRTRIRRGNSSFSEIILSIDGTKVRQGDSMFGQVIMTIDGNTIRRGDSMFGEIMASIDGQTVREGSSMFGTSIATIDGDCVREGTSMFGTTIAKIEGGGRMAGAAAAVFLLLM